MTYATQPRPLLRGVFFNAAPRCVATLCSVMRLNSTQRFINLLPSRCSALHNIAPLRSAPRHNATFYPSIIAARRRHTVLHRTALCFAARCCASQLNATFYQFIILASPLFAAHHTSVPRVAPQHNATFYQFIPPPCRAWLHSDTPRAAVQHNATFHSFFCSALLRYAALQYASIHGTPQRFINLLSPPCVAAPRNETLRGVSHHNATTIN